jgi:hypothetical protein
MNAFNYCVINAFGCGNNEQIYRVSQEERSIFWEVTVSVILSKKVYMYMCHIPNGFRDRAVSLYSSKIVDKKEITMSVCLPIYLSICGSTVLLLDLGRFFSFLIPLTVCRTPLTGDQPVGRPLPTHTTTQTQNKLTQTSMR